MAGLTALRERKILDLILLHLAGDEKGFTIKEKNEEDPLAPRSIFVSQPSDTLRSILNFAVVAERFAKDYLDFAIVNDYRRHNTKQDRKHNKRLSDWYQDYNVDNRPLAGLPEEILDKILGLLTTKPGHLLPITDRASLSVDSFSSTAAPSPEDSNQIKIFRLVCHRFAKLGLRRLFVRVRIRFSSEGFSTLREIAQRQDFRGTIKQFSYMIPRFYPPDGRTLEAKLEEVRANVDENKRKLALRAQGRVAQDRQQPTAQELRIALRRGEAEEEQLTIALGKARQQREIIEQEIDVKTLVYALTNFKNLQQIRLMKVVDFHDKWEKYLAAHADVAAEFRPFEWSYAYEHAARTLAFAIQESNSGVDRFSSRFMDPHTPILVTQELRRTISSIAERAIVLEFEFRQTDALVSLEQKMLQLSGLFQIGFNAAVENLRFLHIGFTRPVSIPLVDIFHNIHLKKLEHIGLHNWQMQGEELLDFLRRHKNTLKSLRLRHVLLRRNLNCSWRHVLQFVRSEIRLPQNGYVSLRWIDYEDDDIHAADGMNFLNGHAQINAISDEDSDEDSVLNDMSDAWSESTDEIEEDEASDESESNTVVGEQNEEDELDDLDDSTDESHESLESHDEDDDLTRIFPTISIVETEPLPCGCANGTRWDDLDDDGNAVTRAQWSRWQKWVIKHCSKCDPSIAEDS